MDRPLNRHAAMPPVAASSEVLLRISAGLPRPCYLLVAGSPQPLATELLRMAAACAEKVVAIDAGALNARAAGLLVDALVGDMDSIDAALLAVLTRAGTEILAVDAYKDETDLQLALACARRAGARSALIAGVLGGRLDHQLAALGACAGASDRLLQVVFDEDTVVWIGGTGSVIEVGRYLELGQTFSTIALGSPAVVSETGVEWELCDARLGPLDPRGISNVVRSANARVATGEGAIALIVPLGLTVPISQAATRRATGI